jgi:hypothetical protein
LFKATSASTTTCLKGFEWWLQVKCFLTTFVNQCKLTKNRFGPLLAMFFAFLSTPYLFGMLRTVLSQKIDSFQITFRPQPTKLSFFVLIFACTVERAYRDRAEAASCFRSFQLALAEYCRWTERHVHRKVKASKLLLQISQYGRARARVSTDGLPDRATFGMYSRHKKRQFEPAGAGPGRKVI